MSNLAEYHELFPVKDAVQPDEPTCVSEVYRVSERARLMGMLNRHGPILVSAPGVQGKTSFLLWMGDYLRTNAADSVEVINVECHDAEYCDRKFFGHCIGRELQANEGAHHFGEMLESSSRLKGSSDKGLTTVLLIDSAKCHSEDVLEWLLYSASLLVSDFRDVARDRRVTCLITEDCETSMLPRWRVAEYDFPRLVLRDFDLIETRSFCERLERASGPSHHVRFDAGAPQQLHEETGGDKYFVPIVAKCATELVGRRSGDATLVVTVDDIRAAAERVRLGASDDPRVIEVVDKWIETAVRRDAKLRDALMGLVDFGPKVWNDLNASAQLALFQKGVVGLAPRKDGRQLTIEEVIEDPARASEAWYQIRKMLPERIRRKVDALSPPRSKPPKKRRGLAKLFEEEQSFLRQRDELRKAYPGKFVAVHEGEVIDSDEDEFELAARIEAAYPDTEVLIQNVDIDEEVWEISSPFDVGER